jgi:hypothetical protein
MNATDLLAIIVGIVCWGGVALYITVIGHAIMRKMSK